MTPNGTGASTDSWMEASYAAQILDFTKIARERGIVDALNTYATGFFSSIAVNQMVTAAGTIGQYIKNKLDAGQTEQVDLENGETATGVRVENTETILLFDSEGNVGGLKDGAKLIFGDIGIDGQGKMGLFSGYIEGTYIPGLGLTMDIENGYATNARIIDPITGETLYWVKPTSDGGHILFDSYGDYLDAKIDDYLQNISFSYENGEIVDFGYHKYNPDDNFDFTLFGDGFNSLLFSTVENGEIVADKLSISDNWLNISNQANSTTDITDDLVGVCDLALNRLLQGQDVDLNNIATQTEWQSILDASTLINAWSQESADMFSNAMFSPLAPGTKVFANILGDDTFKQELLGQANDVSTNSSYYKELAELALGIIQPGSSAITDNVNTTGFWEGLKTAAQTLWSKKDLIVTTTSEVAQFITNPSKYVNDRFWTSDIGVQFMDEIENYYEQTDLTNQFFTIASDAATGGVASVFDTVGYDNLWAGFKEVAENVWDNRNNIIGNITEINSFVSNPYEYLWSNYLATPTGKTYQEQILEFYCLKQPNTYVSLIDVSTNTAMVDMDLNYANLAQQSLVGILDVLTFVQIKGVGFV